MDKADSFKPSDVQLLDSQLSYDGFYQIKNLTLSHRLFAGGWSGEVTRELFVRPEAVGVLLYDPKLDTVALIEQFRVGAFGHINLKQSNDSPWLLELVAGLIDKEETVTEVAERESLEEAGVKVLKLEPIHRFYSSPGGSTEYCYLFCGCADLSTAGGLHGLNEESEDIKVHVFSFEQCRQLLNNGEIINGLTLISLQWLVIHHADIRRRWLKELEEPVKGGGKS